MALLSSHRGEDNLHSILVEGECILTIFVDTVDVILLWSSKNYMTHIHVDDIKEDLILVCLDNREGDEALLCHFRLSHAGDPSNCVRRWMCLSWQTQLIHHHLGNKVHYYQIM